LSTVSHVWIFGENKGAFQGKLGKNLRNEVVVVCARNWGRNELDFKQIEDQKTCGSWGGRVRLLAGNEHVIAA